MGLRGIDRGQHRTVQVSGNVVANVQNVSGLQFRRFRHLGSGGVAAASRNPIFARLKIERLDTLAAGERCAGDLEQLQRRIALEFRVLDICLGRLQLLPGFGLALTYTAPTGEPDDWSETGLLEWTLLVLLFLAAFALVGAAIGSLEALVLRRAAEGMRNWIAISALAAAVMVLTAIPVLLFYPADGTFVREVATEGVVFVSAVAGGFVMLLALRRLRPRTA